MPENEITLNGEKYLLLTDVESRYIKKEQAKIPPAFEHYPVEVESRLHTKLKKLLKPVVDCITEYDAVKEAFGVMDGANVLMVVARSMRARALLRRYVSVDVDLDARQRIPELTYTEGAQWKSWYSVDYMLPIMDFFSATKESKNDSVGVNFKIGTDYPITICNDDFEFILAPRVSNE
jgi:hypothetical protein